MSNPVAIETRNVSKRYQLRSAGLRELWRGVTHKSNNKNDFWALRDIDLSIRKGESWGIIGKNGSGKTTLLRILAGITSPTTGTVQCNGTVAAMLSVGVGFNVELTGRENVFLNGTILGFTRREIETRFDDIVAFSEIGQFIDVPVKRYSSGMRVRLAFAVAAFLQPEIWLIDEVLAVGDVAFRQKALEHLKEMASTPDRTVLLVSHNMGAVQDFCEHAIWLERGRIRAMGDVESVVQEYLRFISVEADVAQENEDETHEGTQQARITKVDILNGSGEPSLSFLRGDTVIFRIHYVTKERLELPMFTFRVIGVDNRVTTSKFHSIHDGLVLDHIEGSGYVDIVVPDIPWMPGRYRYIPSIEGSLDNVIYDLVRSRVNFSVLPDAKLLRTKYKFDQTHMAVYVPSTWTHCSKSESNGQ